MEHSVAHKILYEDNHIIVLNKSTSDLVQGDKTGDESLAAQLKNYLKDKYHKPGEVYLGIPHRLDRPVSGLIIFARTSKSMSRLSNMFREKKIKKTYHAIIKTPPPHSKDSLTHYLQKNERKNKSFVYTKSQKGAKESILKYETLGHSDRYHLLKINLETGRHHQIRAQLAEIGCPIKGDLKYGYARSNQNKGISLHAFALSFTHPVRKNEMHFSSLPPKDDLWYLFDYYSEENRAKTTSLNP